MKIILVMSGKGGVGKTTVAVNLSYFLSKKGTVGLLDADIHGPNVLKIIGSDKQKMKVHDNKIVPIQITPSLKVSSIGGLIDTHSAIIWRGPLKHKALNQLINDTEWGDLDYLVVDFPAGTGDELISVAQLLKEITGAVIVSTPQQVSLLDMRRAIDFCKKMNIKIIGLIENMSGGMFGEGTVKKICKDEGLKFLGTIRLNKNIVISGEEGRSIYDYDDKELIDEFNHIADEIFNKISTKNTKKS